MILRRALQTFAATDLLCSTVLGKKPSLESPRMLTVRFASVSVCRCGCGGVTFGNCGSQKYQRPVPEVVLATQMSYKWYSTKSNDRLELPGKQSAVLESPGFRKDAIRFCNQVGVNFTDKKHLLAPFVHESYLLANNGKLSGSFESNEKLAFLGAQEIRKCITEHLYHNFPELTARDIWDIQTGLLEDHVLSKARSWNLKQIVLYSRQPLDLMLRQAVLALVGAVYTFESPERADAFVKSHLIPELTTSEIKELKKLQHPKFILQSITDKLGHLFLQTRLDYVKKSKSNLHMDNPFVYSVSVLCGEERKVLAQEVSHSLTLAEKKACQKALVTCYDDEFHNFHLKIDDDNFALETNIDLGLITSEQRIIELDKGSESFGFHIKGGEKKKKATEQWLVFHYTTPIFISYIVPGGVADRHGGLSVGDRILAVNDQSLEGLNHERSVRLLKSVSGCVTLTVSHCREALVTDQVEMKYKEMRRKKRMAELASDIWSDWHQAQANRNPSQYQDILKYNDINKANKSPF